MLFFLLAVTLALFVAGVALPDLSMAPPQFWAHLVLGIGVMSLITAAMQHFIPVLCRGRGSGVWLARLPWFMAAAGAVVSLSFLGLLPYLSVAPAAGMALLGVLAMLVWIRGMERATLGKPHAGLAWYWAALMCLGLGLLAALLIPFFPHWHAPLRAFHLHVNLYGFVGLTAVGTLQVLMPTVANRPDPAAALRLRQDLNWALAGALMLAMGKALDQAALSIAGVAAWGWVMGRMGLAWWRLYRLDVFSFHGGVPMLAASWVGFCAALLALMASLVDSGLTASPLAIFLPGFLFPLVSGAAGYLAPIWLRPGVATDWHAESRRGLARWGGVRALLFVVAGVFGLLGYPYAGLFGLTALFWFLVLFAIWLLRR